ncbi:39S ribosomal protein L46, mitochondrial isoform X2 [Gambusia affinis]|uniref:39S ribosomal protein L46, mitochondrial isoform X2 n=1 Tax=Gambusia affinis TaxID=33528 RepID=UPI001CDC394A|nr:39S ribosomal protein L46, mitochondrial isoform X2 [Gambusia affinis]
MAAPCRKMASRSFSRLLCYFSSTAVGSGACRRFSVTPIDRATPLGSTAADRATSPWSLMAAVCLQRLPVISADCSPIEQRFKQMLQQMELEKSLVSDHELRLLEDAEKMSRRQAADYDSDEEDRGDQEIMMTQDLEDTWEQRLKNFHPAPRVRADVDEDLSSAQRCLADSLVLLAEQQVGAEKLWLLPQAAWQEGETLRQTAERALDSVTAGVKATFLGNAPCGVYKYKLPKAARTEGSVGRKVFFFKAILADGAPGSAPTAPLLWVKKSELQEYLKPAYMTKVDRFILNL